MTRQEQIQAWVKEYELGYYFNPGGVEFFCPAFQNIEHCQVSEYVGDDHSHTWSDGKTTYYKDDKGFEKLSRWIEKNRETFKKEKPKEYTYYSEGQWAKIIKCT